ncbi:hypothetical protein DTO271D3_8263 [Paecilomyces variotii]|nr:hypothetical protein DTO271D3_8263 [Paecilomyces variotii]
MISLSNILLLIASAATVAAAPAPVTAWGTKEPLPFSQSSWNEGAVTKYPIHLSCNATQRRQLEIALEETIDLASHARDHILRWGNQSEIYRKYFGNRPSLEAIGAYEVIISGDKGGVLFRCDNPDGNCDLEGYGGHWRGENATDETVICDLSYETRRSLSTMCALGYNVADSKTNTFWAGDLLHRLYHMPAVGQALVEHFSSDYDEALELAVNNGSLSTHNSDTLQYFALESYAYDIAVPGVGCPGPEHTHSHETQPTVTTSATSTTTEAPSTTSELPPNCHTHEGGDVHCT